MIIVFCDTNIVFWIFKRICESKTINNSSISALSKKHKVYISDFVIHELRKNFEEKYDIYISNDNIKEFLNITWFGIIKSNKLNSEVISYVSDLDDAQILQDAVDIYADILLTKNISDFNIRWIYDKRNIKVFDQIPEELF